ncbi:MAG TPA: hypothetical protein PKD45_02265 [Flavobacteriales bacterium]|nr:hypothetical protein [Flavobacteriales bacterium]
MRPFITRFPVLTFVVLTLLYQFIVVGIVWWRLPVGAHMHDDATAHMVFRFRVFGPLAFAMLLTAYLEGKAGLRNLFASFLHWRVPAKWYMLAFSWKFLFTWVGVAVMAVLGIRAWPGFFQDGLMHGDMEPLRQLMRNMPFIVGIAFVEETSWIKYSVTRLQERYHALTSCLLVGLGWGLWYLPMLLVGEGVPDGYPWHTFMTSMVALTVLLGWAFNMTRSGTVLLIMQIISNCAFFLLPVLPGWWDMDVAYITAFVWANVGSAVLLTLVFGWRELGRGKRATWSEGLQAHA